MSDYEKATNSHNFNRVRPHIADNAVFFFTEGTHRGLKEIEFAFETTWQKIQEEVYTIDSVEWLHVAADSALCTYRFHWRGVVDGERKKGEGRGTNLLVRNRNTWQIAHEHLTSDR